MDKLPYEVKLSIIRKLAKTQGPEVLKKLSQTSLDFKNICQENKKQLYNDILIFFQKKLLKLQQEQEDLEREKENIEEKISMNPGVDLYEVYQDELSHKISLLEELYEEIEEIEEKISSTKYYI